eukprot:6449577-Prymnesium_polylepis.1
MRERAPSAPLAAPGALLRFCASFAPTTRSGFPLSDLTCAAAYTTQQEVTKVGFTMPNKQNLREATENAGRRWPRRDAQQRKTK